MLNLISFLSFLIPFQIGIHFNYFASTVYGFKIDYLIPTVYVTDIVAILIIMFGISKFKFSKKYIVYNQNLLLWSSILYIGFVAINILHSTYYLSTIYKWIRVTELILLGLIILNSKKFDVFKNFLKPLSVSVMICCSLGVWQYFIQGSVGGLFYFLGERAFMFNNPSIAPYPYSTFSHPNSFAGFLLVYSIFILRYKNKFNFKYFITLFILVVINIVLTNSLNVYLTICLLLVLKFHKNLLQRSKLGSLFSFFAFSFSDRFIDFISLRFITHRIELMQSSLEMIRFNFWFGVGLNNFIPSLVKVSNKFLNSWELQPVHNIFLLIFSELGIVGLIAFVLLLMFSLHTSSFPLYAILLTGLSDHYWLTLQQNMLLFVYVLAISLRWKKNI